MSNKSFENYLLQQVQEGISRITKEAMRYSLINGGKRIRPQLLFDALKGYGCEETLGYPAACALEMIHTYSLIHDDLPAMDDDDVRRGQPSCHIEYDEATAILAGDGLLTRAFDVLCQSETDPATIVEMVRQTSQYAGVDGMIYGQELDIHAEEAERLPLEEIETIDYYKTGKLLTLPFIYAALLAGKEEDIDIWIEIGSSIGLQFQILDDILDVTKSEQELGKSTSDEENHKQTYVSLMGLDAAKARVTSLHHEILESLKNLEIDDSYLKNTLEYLVQRSH